MLIYSYQCKICHKWFERLECESQEPLMFCPFCGGMVYRLVSETIDLDFQSSADEHRNQKIQRSRRLKRKSEERTKVLSRKVRRSHEKFQI